MKTYMVTDYNYNTKIQMMNRIPKCIMKKEELCTQKILTGKIKLQDSWIMHILVLLEQADFYACGLCFIFLDFCNSFPIFILNHML